MRKRLIPTMLTLLGSLVFSTQSTAAVLETMPPGDFTRDAVRRILHLFAYGGHATDGQINRWAKMGVKQGPEAAIREMLTFDAVNAKLASAQNGTPAGGLEELRAFLSSDHPDNRTCPSKRPQFDMTNVQRNGDVVLASKGLQNAFLASVNKRGSNPFLARVAFWLTNYHMAVSLRSAKASLIMSFYDDVVRTLEDGAPLHEVLALGATDASIAYQYGHRNNVFRNAQARRGRCDDDPQTELPPCFKGNDDLARELHQLFFRINGRDYSEAYHENVTIENTALALTGMQLDKIPFLYDTTRQQDWWAAPIDFTNHTDAAGRTVNNQSRHHTDDLEILETDIPGATAEDKLYALAEVAITEGESLDNLSVAIISHFADDNLTPDKAQVIRAAWARVVGQPDDLLKFLRAYAVSTIFHRPDTYKYRSAFDRNISVYNLNTVDPEESDKNSGSPKQAMIEQGAELFIPAHAVFGGQTSREAAESPAVFEAAYNSAVDKPSRIIKNREVCRDEARNILWIWDKDWARVIPIKDGYRVKDVARWLWTRFISDGGKNYRLLEKTNIYCLLATGYDCGYLLNPERPDAVPTRRELRSLRDTYGTHSMALDSTNPATRREANRRVGLAINFATATPFSFAIAAQ